MAPIKRTILERIQALSHIDGDHLTWTGKMSRGRPFLKGVGHPVRHLLNIDHPNIQVRNACGRERCIEPHHYRVIVERDRKYGDLQKPKWRDPRRPDLAQFTELELEDIELEVEAIKAGETSVEELDVYAPHVKSEILRRVNNDGPKPLNDYGRVDY